MNDYTSVEELEVGVAYWTYLSGHYRQALLVEKFRQRVGVLYLVRHGTASEQVREAVVPIERLRRERPRPAYAGCLVEAPAPTQAHAEGWRAGRRAAEAGPEVGS